MSHIRIDKQKALKKWAPVLENMGVAGEERLDWMSEYAEFHSINENAYANTAIAGNTHILKNWRPLLDCFLFVYSNV